MSQFDDWPAEDLRLFKQILTDGELRYLVYSFQIDALTPVNEEEVEQLLNKGVLEIDKLPD